VSEIHAALLATVHAQSRATPIASVPVPPDDSNEEADGVTVGWHRLLVGPVGLDTLVVAELPQAAAESDAVRMPMTAIGGTRATTASADAQRSPELGAKVAVATLEKIAIIALVRKSGSSPPSTYTPGLPTGGIRLSGTETDS
jgi:hypothetical protein